jgi:staphylococcal nuclease domain-containing protein 1
MLMVDEVEAVQRKKGMHGPQATAAAAAAAPSDDLTSDSKKAKTFFATLNKDKTYKAIIEHVFTGSRFKVSIPSEGVTLQIALAQVRTPVVTKTPPPSSSSAAASTSTGTSSSAEGVTGSETEPSTATSTDTDTATATAQQEPLEEGEIREHPLVKWVEAGKRFSRHSLLQRKVDIEIADMDRNGIMLGKVYSLGEGNKPKAVAFSLVERGLASVDKYAQRRGGGEVSALLELQDNAKSEKRGMWVVPDAVPEAQKDRDAAEGRRRGGARGHLETTLGARTCSE